MTTIAASNNEELVDEQLRVLDEENGEWIRYPTPTHALIAKLHLESHVPAAYINLFLDTLRNPHFDPKKLAFRSCSDIDRSVAEYRRAQSVKRSTATTASNSSDINLPSRARLPFDVLALIIEAIAHERHPLGNDDPTSLLGIAKYSSSVPDRIASRLKALSLTHRSLTPLAQRALGQRIIVQNAEQLRALSRSPLLGSWTTELLLNLNFPCSPFAGMEEALCCAAEILRDPLLSGLRHLRIRSPALLASRSKESLLGVLKAIGSLKKLEALCWITPDRAPSYMYVDMEDCLRSVCRLSNLRRLAVHNANCGWKDFRPDDILLRFRLQELSLSNFLYPAGPLGGTCVSWLLEDSNLEASTGPTSTLKSLTLGYARGNSLESILASRSDTLSRLHTLHLKFTHPPEANFFSRVFKHSSSSLSPHPTSSTLAPGGDGNLRTLHISCDFFGSGDILTEDTLSGIPRTVRCLRLTFLHLPYNNIDWCITQKNEVIRFLEREDTTLEELEVIVDKCEPSVKFSWNDISGVDAASRCRITVKEEVVSQISARRPRGDGIA